MTVTLSAIEALDARTALAGAIAALQAREDASGAAERLAKLRDLLIERDALCFLAAAAVEVTE